MRRRPVKTITAILFLLLLAVDTATVQAGLIHLTAIVITGTILLKLLNKP